MHVVVFNQHYHNPDCPNDARHYWLLQRLVRDHAVTLISSSARQDQRITSDFDWIPPGVHMHAVDVPYANKMGVKDRLQSYASYALKALIRGLVVPRPDVLFAASTPLTTPAAASVVARIRNLPWIFEVTDLWPDFPIQMGAIPSIPLQRSLYALEHHLYRHAAHVVTLSPDMEAHVRPHADGTPVTTVEYGTDLSLLDGAAAAMPVALQQELDAMVGDRRLILYAGSFGRANDLPTLLDAARRLRGRDDVCFLFVGSGYDAPRVEQAAASLPHVHRLDPQPYPRSLALFQRAVLSLVSFVDRPVLATNAPTKLFDSLSAGTPVIVTNNGWTRALVERHRCGWFVPPSSPTALATQIATLLDDPPMLDAAGRRGRTVAQERFDRVRNVDRLARLIERVGASA